MAEDVLAPLAGKVISVHIEAGTQVEEDEEIIIIEAMKMETPIYAPCDGKVASVKVKAGDEIQEDDVLAVIE